MAHNLQQKLTTEFIGTFFLSLTICTAAVYGSAGDTEVNSSCETKKNNLSLIIGPPKTKPLVSPLNWLAFCPFNFPTLSSSVLYS